MNTPSNIDTSVESFGTIYCQKYGVSPERFSKSLMLRSCHCWTRPITLLFLIFCPNLLARDLQHLDSFRGICTTRDYDAELVFIKTYNKYDLPRWRKALQIWPSTRKLSRFARLLE